jgi:hypothetical protein
MEPGSPDPRKDQHKHQKEEDLRNENNILPFGNDTRIAFEYMNT